MTRPRAIVLRAPGTNCDEETALAWTLAGAEVESVHVGRLLESPALLDQFQILTIPGGFSYGDDLGAGRIFAARLGTVLRDALTRFHERGGLVLGICNGFQVLVRAGLLPGPGGPPATLTFNDCGHFESRWVKLGSRPGRSPFVVNSDTVELPVAHGEGKFVVASQAELSALEASGQVLLRYVDESGRPTQTFPANPNGSIGAVAGLCDPSGRVFGLMPHPERHVDPYHHPRWTRRGARREGDGLRFFRNAVAAFQ
jgi:phosphoribosylformylglycinamidine synthase